MSERMTRLAEILKAEQILPAVLANLVPGRIPLKIFSLLDDPNENPDVRQLFVELLKRWEEQCEKPPEYFLLDEGKRLEYFEMILLSIPFRSQSSWNFRSFRALVVKPYF